MLDFGLARIASSKLTRAGLVFGTPDYMLPEHVRGTVVDVRSDIFSLGAVCYQMLSGRKPFAAKALPEVMRKVLTEEPVPLTRAEAPPSLARVIARALEKDPLNRHQKVEELLADLCKVDPDAPVDAAASEGEPKKIDRYQILERVGRGGMGVVYRARDPVLDRDVAIKSMLVDFGVDQDARGRFQQEARAAARLQHPNIVTIYEFGEQDDSPYLIMEFLGGDDLEGLMRRDPPLSLEHRLDIVAQLCDGLAFAHDQGVVHRDIKPGNVRVLEDGSVKLLDFGIATVQKADTTSGTGTFAGSARSVLRLVMGDVGSHVAAERRLGAATPPIVRTPIHASVVDVGGVEGAAVIRVDSGGVAAAAGLRPGDVIVGVGGTAVTAVSDVARALEDADPGRELLMDVRAEDGTVRATAVRVALAPDTIPLADSRLLYNTILLDLRARAARADDTVLRSASRLGLAIVHMRLGSWDLALGALETVSLPDGSGVSGAAVAYLMGLCLKEVGQLPEARGIIQPRGRRG